MKQTLKLLAAVAVLAIGAVGTAAAAPQSTCTAPNPATGSGHVCELFEEDANGYFSEIGWVIPLPTPVVAGVLLILEPGGNSADPTTWSDELVFTTSTVQLLSDGCSSGIEGDVSCFLPFQATSFEDANGFLAYVARPNLYNVHSDGEGPEQIPEPATSCCWAWDLRVSAGHGGASSKLVSDDLALRCGGVDRPRSGGALCFGEPTTARDDAGRAQSCGVSDWVGSAQSWFGTVGYHPGRPGSRS